MKTQLLVDGKTIGFDKDGKVKVSYKNYNFYYEFYENNEVLFQLEYPNSIMSIWMYKYITKHLDLVNYNTTGGIVEINCLEVSETQWKEMQKRVKGKINELIRKGTYVYSDEPTKEPTQDVTIELTKVSKDVSTTSVEPQKPQAVKQVKLVRPKAVGLEGQIQDIVYDLLEGEFTRQTIENKMIQLGIEPNITEVVVKKYDDTKVNVGVQHYNFKKLLGAISVRTNPMLVGPAGSGKTTAVINVAKALGLKFYSKSVSAQTGVHEFFGYQDANGNYVRTLFREAFEFGGVFLLDEIDAGNPNVLASINQAMANGMCAFADGMVNKHKDFIIVGCANTFGNGANADYVGRNPMDGATKDRFVKLIWNYDENLEYQIAKNKGWCKKIQELRAKAEDKKVRVIISPRATFNGEKLIEAGLSEKDVLDMVVFNGLTEAERNLLS